MLLKNNSNNEWLQYNCGHCVVDIEANSVFNVDKQAGDFILRNLGAPNWVVKLEQSNVRQELKVDEQEAPTKETPKKKGCDVCGSKGYIHKKGCSLV